MPPDLDLAQRERRLHLRMALDGFSFVFGLVAIGLLIKMGAGGFADSRLTVISAVLIGAVMVRQSFTMAENATLSRRIANDEEQLDHQARYDPLTGLLNRGNLHKHLQQRLDMGIPLAVLSIDVDDFKIANDILGRPQADKILTAVAGKVQGIVRDNDVAVRMDSDEFAVILENVSKPDQAVEIAERIHVSLTTSFVDTTGWQIVTTSIGISVSDPEAAVTAEELLHRADTAMRRAKTQGKSQTVIWEPMIDSVEKTFTEKKRNELEHAIKQEQYVLHYQPILDMETKEFMAMEALVRWNHPEKGLLMPEYFLGDLEQSKLIVPLGSWILEEACSEIQVLSKHVGHDLDVFVNISAVQLARADFVSAVEQALEKSGLPGERLVIEITETSLVMANEALAERLRTIKRTGVRVALDDFGTGYSSLTHLQLLPIDLLKIDKSFVAELRIGAVTPKLGAVMVDLGASIGKIVIAEGVETKEQEQVLASLGCPLAQGFFYSKPMSVEQVLELLGKDAVTAN